MTRNAAAEVAALLEALPPWSEVPAGDERGLRAIEDAVGPFAAFAADEIVSGVGEFVGRCGSAERGFDVAAMSKPFVVSRFVFAVPDRVPIAARQGFGSFAGVPVLDGVVDELWPWELDEGGALRLRGHFRGYVGETYLAVEEAQFFSVTYGLRDRTR
ncbi:MAG TPA: hypothetical protein VFL38_10470 [Humibacillus xanthopallidus]|nr:hypothetical protein [Humibacillus xanthopallidus]